MSPRAMAARVLPGLSLGVERIGPADLFPQEAAAMTGAVAARKDEFATGRKAARAALGAARPIPMGADRAPVWPRGWVGSITHAGDWALAVASRSHRMVGVDLEHDEDLPAEVWDTILLPAERDWLRGRADAGRLARVIFSAKECAYKAQYPLSRELFGFDVFAVTLGDAVFSARFQRAVGPFRPGDRIDGRFARADGFILTAIAL